MPHAFIPPFRCGSLDCFDVWIVVEFISRYILLVLSLVICYNYCNFIKFCSIVTFVHDFLFSSISGTEILVFISHSFSSVMEPGPSTSEPTLPRTKRRAKHISKNEKIIILNVHKFVQETWPSGKYRSKTGMIIKTANIVGIAKTSVYHILKEYKENGTVMPPATLHTKHTNLVETVDDFQKSYIRRKVHEFYLKGELPTLNKILQAVNSDDMLPNFSRTSLWRLLKHLKFKYAKNKWKSALIEGNDIVLWRIKYLKKIKKYREEEIPIYYLNETLIDAGKFI